MKTLIIYDNEGYIIQTITGFYRVPVGIPYLEIEIPEGKYIAGVNVDTKEPVLEDLPKSENQILKERLEQQELALLELASLIGGTV